MSKRNPRRTTIEQINQTPHAKLRFSEIISLKVQGGRDQYSTLRGEKLWADITPDSKAEIETAFTAQDLRDKTARWILRGLECSKAIRKVKSDGQVGYQAAKGNVDERYSDMAAYERMFPEIETKAVQS